MPQLRMIHHAPEQVHHHDPFFGMLMHPRSTMNELLNREYPGQGAYPMAMLFSFTSGLALSLGGMESLSGIPMTLMAFFSIFVGVFFLMLSSQMIKMISDQYFLGDARGAQVRTAIAWSLVPASAVNLLIIAFALSPLGNAPIEVLMAAGGIVWSFVVMDNSLAMAEAYGDGVAMIVLAVTFAVMLFAFILVYAPLWLLVQHINTMIWYG